MKLFVPFIDAKRQSARFVAMALMSEGLEPVPVRIQDEQYGYWNWLNDTWNAGDPFVVVEHDVVPAWGAVGALMTCERSWCTVPCLVHGGLHDKTFGCVKFGTELLATIPDLFERYPSRLWTGMDSKFAKLAEEAGFKPCVHNPPAHNLSPAHFPRKLKIGPDGVLY